MSIIAYTDYPFTGSYGPIRMVEVTGYDRDKYVSIVFEGKNYFVKRGYLFLKRSAAEEARDKKYINLSKSCTANTLTHKQACKLPNYLQTSLNFEK